MKYFKKTKYRCKKTVLVVLFQLAFLSCGLISPTFAVNEILGKAELDSLVKSQNLQARLGIANGILKIYPPDTSWVLGTILEALKIELDSPASEIRESSNSFTFSQRIVRQHLRNLESFGPAIDDTISSLFASEKGEIKTALIIVLAMHASEPVHDKARNIVLNDPDPNFRGLAAIALAAYKDTSDIPLLLKAINDPYSVMVTNDYALPNHNMTETVHTVSQDAYWALKNGFGVIPDKTYPRGYRYLEKE